MLKAVADLGSPPPPSGFRTPDYPNCPPFGTIFIQFWLYDLEIIVKAPTVPVKTIFKGGARAEKTIVWSKLTKKGFKAFFLAFLSFAGQNWTKLGFKIKLNFFEPLRNVSKLDLCLPDLEKHN